MNIGVIDGQYPGACKAGVCTRCWHIGKFTRLEMKSLSGRISRSMPWKCVTFVAKAWLGQIGRYLKLTEDERGWVGILGRAGYVASGLVFVLAGTFLLLAAIHYNPGQARGLGGALRALEAERFGPALLALVAAGLFAFGVYGIVQGIYRRIRPPDIDKAKSAIAHEAKLTAHS